MLNRLHNYFSRVLLDSLSCLTVCSMMGTHISLQSSGLILGIPMDIILSLVVPTIPKLMVRRRDNTECCNKLLDVCWLSNPCLKQNGVLCYAMLSLPSTQQVQRALGALHLN